MEIRPDHLALVRTILARHVPESEVWAFGSRVDGRPKPYSDLDLAIVGPAPPERCMRRLRDDFEDSDLPWMVDLVVFDDLPDRLRGDVLRRHAVVQPVPAPDAALGSPRNAK
jgi:predicted nucleotidyltransferase